MGLSTAFIALAALCWGISGGIGGILIAEGWDTLVISFYRGAIGLLFVLIWLGFQPHNNGFANRRLWFWSAMAGLGIAGNFTFYFVSIKYSSVPVAATLMYCAPVFVYLISLALKLESASAKKWIALALVMLGIVLLTQIYDISSSEITYMGVAAGLLAGLSYAVFIFGLKYATPHGSPQAILSIAFMVLVVVLILPSNKTQIVAAISMSDWPYFIGIGILGAGVSFILYLVGLQQITPVLASMVAMVEPVTASLFGVLVLNEYLEISQLFGMVLILITVTALSVASSSGRSFSESAPRK